MDIVISRFQTTRRIRENFTNMTLTRFTVVLTKMQLRTVE